jgi:glycyl-tRNA synthetase beta chain
MTGEFLLEVLCEEIPANALPGIRTQLAEGFSEELQHAGYQGFTVRTYSTVRRMIVSVSGLPERQEDREEEVFGPPVRAAFTPDGSPTSAAVGFAKGQGVTIDALRVAKGPKGDVVAVTRSIPGSSTPDVLAEIASRLVRSLHVPKTMRWGQGEEVFVRPVHNVMALFGVDGLKTTVPLTLFGLQARGSTVGHRVVKEGRIEVRGVQGFAEYAKLMASAGVIVDQQERRRTLERRATALASEVGGTVRRDDELMAELVELVEHPGLVRGRIAREHVELPEEVLVTALRHHQKCLVLQKGGKVAADFLAVCDRPDDPEGHVQRGVSWVAGARLADAAFFLSHDRKTLLSARGATLARIVFHQKLGSFQQKCEILTTLAERLADAAELDVDREQLRRAGLMLKADLATNMVGEFPELQGVMGGIYAQEDGEPDPIWQAVADQYVPVGLEGALPRGVMGALLGLADRLDTLAGLFVVGEIPSGSKDPYALRRAALAAVRIAAELPLPVDLTRAIAEAVALRSSFGKVAVEEATGTLSAFVLERVRHYMVAVLGVKADVAEAVLQARWGVLPDDVARARALSVVRQDPALEPLSLTFKRVRNILAKGGRGRFAAELLQEPAEVALLQALAQAETQVAVALAEGDHEAGLHALAGLYQPLDQFFVDVLVMCPDQALCDARLALLARIEELFLKLADVSRLSVEVA